MGLGRPIRRLLQSSSGEILVAWSRDTAEEKMRRGQLLDTVRKKVLDRRTARLDIVCSTD